MNNSSVMDSIEARMEEKEDRKHKRETQSINLGMWLVFTLLMSLVLTIGLTTHRSNMLEQKKSERLNQRCLDQGWNPLWCRKMVDYNWVSPHQYTKSKPNKKKADRKKSDAQ